MQQRSNAGSDGLTQLNIEPAAIQAWLREFSETVANIERRRNRMRDLTFGYLNACRADELPFARELSVKLRDRFGEADGGVADGYGQVVQQLKQLHDAMRHALATHLGADFEAEDIMNLLGAEAGE